jgi:hypothetical protein
MRPCSSSPSTSELALLTFMPAPLISPLLSFAAEVSFYPYFHVCPVSSATNVHASSYMFGVGPALAGTFAGN